MKKLKISIITITYNSEKTLKDTIESVLMQQYRPLEYVVVDGKSTDSTLKILKMYEEKFFNCGIEYKWISEKDKGISDAFNKGIFNSSGELIGIINSDDKLASNSVDLLAQNYSNDTGVYFGNCIIFNNNNSNEYIAIPKFSKDKNLLKIGMALYHPSTFITRKTYEKCGAYDTNLKMCMDRDMLLRIYKNGEKFKYIDESLAYYREGGTNQANYLKTARENEIISRKYGMNWFLAKMIKYYFYIHDAAWKLIKKLRLERLFHKEIKPL